jgi:hypothetical protein
MNVTGISAFANNTYDLGTSAFRWRDIYTTNAVNVSSDARDKLNVAAVTDAALDAWDTVPLKQFAYSWEPSKTHYGFVAQDVDAAFAANGLDVKATGVARFDTWDETNPETGEVTQKDRWSVGQTEALFLEAAAMRRKVAALEARLAAVEAKIPPL